MLAGEENRAPDVLGTPGTGDQRGVSIYHGVEDATRVVVSGIAWPQEVALQSRPERAESHLVDSTRGSW